MEGNRLQMFMLRFRGRIPVFLKPISAVFIGATLINASPNKDNAEDGANSGEENREIQLRLWYVLNVRQTKAKQEHILWPLNFLNQPTNVSVVTYPELETSAHSPGGRPNSNSCCFRFLGKISIGDM